jgi:hypothetical protein
MSTAPQPALLCQEKLYKDKNGHLYFTIVYCPACKLKFRLLWPSNLLRYPEKATLHLKCPGCDHSFTSLDLTPYTTCHVAHGCEHCPTAPVEHVSS